MKTRIIALRNKNILPTFSTCLVDYFQKDLNSVLVKWNCQNELFILEEDKDGYELRHSPECPMKILANSGTVVDIENTPTIGLATSVLIESSDNHILLTKRSPTLRSSPNVWVPPGGHLDNNETTFDAGVREVKEETGLDINRENFEILGLWENVYPLMLGIGMPRSHVLIVYLHILLNECHKNLMQKIKPNAQEVTSYCWINKPILLELFKVDSSPVIGKQYIIENDSLIETDLNYSSMFNTWLWRQAEPYSGVNFCLRKWLEKNKQENVPSKY
ncbi:hypothetical protein RUM43_000702 [Polyplax serrata]|uniref:m7GpppN-mRNA hydrolase NUDT17 n=1 Tax=Polyplax serrata TaxID=468196 RepID=A0AAN8SHK7_POLSC